MKHRNLALCIAALFACFGQTLKAEDNGSEIFAVMDTTDKTKLVGIYETWKNSAEEIAPLLAGIALHNLAMNDPVQYASQAVDMLAKYKGSKYASIATAYRGSAVTLVASAYSKKGNMISASTKLTEGFALIDSAVKKDSGNMVIRILRMENGMAITETTPFNRSKEVQEDLDFLASRLNSLKPERRSQYYLNLGRLRLFQKKVKEAMSALNQAIKEAPDSSYSKQAKVILAKLED